MYTAHTSTKNVIYMIITSFWLVCMHHTRGASTLDSKCKWSVSYLMGGYELTLHFRIRMWVMEACIIRVLGC